MCVGSTFNDGQMAGAFNGANRANVLGRGVGRLYRGNVAAFSKAMKSRPALFPPRHDHGKIVEKVGT